MPVVELMEYENPKDEEKNAKRRKFQSKVMRPYWEKLVKAKDIKVESSGWADNTGNMVHWTKFETLEDAAKAWNDPQWQQLRARWAYFANNITIRLLRPSFTIPEDMFK
jgi:hypothetical protein